MAHYEIEVKSLLGEKEYAERLRERMRELDPTCERTSRNTQLNHYFEGGDVRALLEATKDLFTADVLEKFIHIVEVGTSFSVRTRKRDDEVLLVVKASVDSGSSANSVSRLEFEEPVVLTLDELDERVLAAGFQYQAKWSREREEYAYKGANVCIDKNAGYGFLAEIEKIVHDESLLSDTRREIDELMTELGIEELSQDRLERMFAHYNQNWRDYYGTDRTFIIE